MTILEIIEFATKKTFIISHPKKKPRLVHTTMALVIKTPLHYIIVITYIPYLLTYLLAYGTHPN